jgi:BCD family chlorophyll transporter-like MFS transporter
MASSHLGWFGIVRLGLVQAALGAVVVLTTSTINRVMIVELMLPAVVPGLFVTWHYALQVLRPSWGHGSDKGGRRTPWIMPSPRNGWSLQPVTGLAPLRR